MLCWGIYNYSATSWPELFNTGKNFNAYVQIWAHICTHTHAQMRTHAYKCKFRLIYLVSGHTCKLATNFLLYYVTVQTISTKTLSWHLKSFTVYASKQAILYCMWENFGGVFPTPKFSHVWYNIMLVDLVFIIMKLLHYSKHVHILNKLEPQY